VSVIVDRSQTPPVLRLEGDIDIGYAAELKAALEEALAEGRKSHNPLRLSLATATGCDVTALQLLWIAERELRAAGIAVAMEGSVPEALRATAHEAGMEKFPCAEEVEKEPRG